MNKDTYRNLLTKSGQEIYNQILKHCEELDASQEIDFLHLTLLANAFDLYRKAALIVKEKGATQKPDKGGWDQVRPEFTIMRNMGDFIYKHSDKFGMNPASRVKYFKPKEDGKKRGKILAFG